MKNYVVMEVLKSFHIKHPRAVKRENILDALSILKLLNIACDETKAVVRMRENEGLTWEEIGEELKISATSARNQYKAFEETAVDTLFACTREDLIAATDQPFQFSLDPNFINVDKDLEELDLRSKLKYVKKYAVNNHTPKRKPKESNCYNIFSEN